MCIRDRLIGGSFTPIAGETNRSLALPSLQLSADNGRQFRVVVTNSFGSATSTAALLSLNAVNLPPTAVVSVEPDSGEVPLTINFDASSSTDDIGIAAYEWDFGDGKSVTTSTPLTSHSFSAGTYDVQLTVRDEVTLRALWGLFCRG